MTVPAPFISPCFIKLQVITVLQYLLID
jgi:hypothetical protein